jgi:hypothetical protein
MYKIAKVLMDYGMDFRYEHNGSEGEELRSFEIDLYVWTNRGNIYIEHSGETKKYEESEGSFEYVSELVDQICIDETT